MYRLKKSDFDKLLFLILFDKARDYLHLKNEDSR